MLFFLFRTTMSPTCSDKETSQHQEKNGAFFWNLWVKVLLKFRNFSDVPMWPLDLSTNTLGIWTNWRGLFPSLRACDRLRICPLNTDICFSNIDLSQPRSVCKNEMKILDFPVWRLSKHTRKSFWRSSQRSWTKFISLTFGSNKSLVSWENGTWNITVNILQSITPHYFLP